jgi:hypothetical protein
MLWPCASVLFVVSVGSVPAPVAVKSFNNQRATSRPPSFLPLLIGVRTEAVVANFATAVIGSYARDQCPVFFR